MAGYIGSKAVITSGVSASIDELNIIDGVTATTAELNILDGVTSTAAELNILDGVTSTAAELNILDGVTATATELNLIDGVTATTAELNILDGVTATAAEINLIDGGTARGTTAIVDADGVLVNDAGTMRMTTMATLATYMGTKGLGPAYTRGATIPSSPNAGDWWLNTDQDSLYIYDATEGWKTNTLHDFGRGTYQVPGNFSIQYTGGLNRFSFQGPAVGTSEGSALVQGVINATISDGTHALSNSVRGVYGTGVNDKKLGYVIMATSADALDFGTLVVPHIYNAQSASHETRGIIAGGNDTNAMDYITIANAGNATDFGNQSVGRQYMPAAAMASTVRAIFKGGNAGSSASNVMDYVTIANTGNATDFGNVGGDLDGREGCNANNTTRGIMAGNNTAATNTIEYITMGTTGNSTDFGNLTATDNTRCALHSSTLAYLHGGEDVITMATAANASASGYEFRFTGHLPSIMPGWIAYNG